MKSDHVAHVACRPHNKKAPSWEAGGLEQRQFWSDDVDLPGRDEIGAFHGTDLEQLMGVGAEVAAGGVEEHAEVG